MTETPNQTVTHHTTQTAIEPKNEQTKNKNLIITLIITSSFPMERFLLRIILGVPSTISPSIFVSDLDIFCKVENY